MTAGQIRNLWTLFYILIMATGILLIWFVAMTGIWHPIKKKDEHEKKIAEEKKELHEIQRAKGLEWDKYKEQQDELDRLRKAYFQLKERSDKEKEEYNNLQIEKDKLVVSVRALKKQVTEHSEKPSEKPEK